MPNESCWNGELGYIREKQGRLALVPRLVIGGMGAPDEVAPVALSQGAKRAEVLSRGQQHHTLWRFVCAPHKVTIHISHGARPPQFYTYQPVGLRTLLCVCLHCVTAFAVPSEAQLAAAQAAHQCCGQRAEAAAA